MATHSCAKATQQLGFSLIVKNTFIDIDEDLPAKCTPLKRAVTAPAATASAAWKEDQCFSCRSSSDVASTAPGSDSEEDQASQTSESPVLSASHSAWEPRREQCKHCVSTTCQSSAPAVYGQWQPMYGQWQLPHSRDAQWQPMWAMGEGGQCEMVEQLPASLLPAEGQGQAAEPEGEGREQPQQRQQQRHRTAPAAAQQESLLKTPTAPHRCAGSLEVLQCQSLRQPAARSQVTEKPAAVVDTPPTAEGDWEALEKVAGFHPQTLSRWRNHTTGAMRIVWTVDGKKFRGNDRLTVSPGFLLSDTHGNDALPFKMMIHPHGGGSFRKAAGKGVVQLKCESPGEVQDSITFRLSVGSGHHADSGLQAPRGPVTHNFGQSGICGLPKKCEVWDFSAVLDEPSQTFVVLLDVGAADVHGGN